MSAAGEHKRSMRLVSFKPVDRGTLRGFATVELPIGLAVGDCAVFYKNGNAWVMLPSRPVLGVDGRQLETSGKKQFAPVARWASRELADRWSAAVVSLIEAAHLAAFDEAGR